MHFAQAACHVTIVIRGDSLKSTLSQYLIDRIAATPNINVLTQTEVTALDGDEVLREITLTQHTSGNVAHGGEQVAVRLHRRRATDPVGE